MFHWRRDTSISNLASNNSERSKRTSGCFLMRQQRRRHVFLRLLMNTYIRGHLCTLFPGARSARAGTPPARKRGNERTVSLVQ